MRKLTWDIIAIVLLYVVVILLVNFLPTHAQDNSDTSVSICYTHVDDKAVFQFSNIPDTWLSGIGWYYIGDDASVDGHTIRVIGLQFDNGYSYAIVGDNQYAENYTGYTNLSPECTPDVKSTPVPEPTDVPMSTAEYQQPIAQPVISTGRVCTIKYPEIVLICNR